MKFGLALILTTSLGTSLAQERAKDLLPTPATVVWGYYARTQNRYSWFTLGTQFACRPCHHVDRPLS